MLSAVMATTIATANAFASAAFPSAKMLLA